jgi:hypothetical protein
MNRIKIILTIAFILTLNQNIFSQQFHDYSFLEPKSDSVVISNLQYRSKEFIAPLAVKIKPAVKDSLTGKWKLSRNDSVEIKDTIIVKSRKRILKSEILKLNKLLNSKSSYTKKGIALLNDYNIEICYFRKGEIFQWVKISTLTNKITIKKENCQETKDTKGNNIDPCLYYSSISKSFKKDILKFMKK